MRKTFKNNAWFEKLFWKTAFKASFSRVPLRSPTGENRRRCSLNLTEVTVSHQTLKWAHISQSAWGTHVLSPSVSSIIKQYSAEGQHITFLKHPDAETSINWPIFGKIIWVYSDYLSYTCWVSTDFVTMVLQAKAHRQQAWIYHIIFGINKRLNQFRSELKQNLLLVWERNLAKYWEKKSIKLNWSCKWGVQPLIGHWDDWTHHSFGFSKLYTVSRLFQLSVYSRNTFNGHTSELRLQNVTETLHSHSKIYKCWDYDQNSLIYQQSLRGWLWIIFHKYAHRGTLAPVQRFWERMLNRSQAEQGFLQVKFHSKQLKVDRKSSSSQTQRSN